MIRNNNHTYVYTTRGLRALAMFFRPQGALSRARVPMGLRMSFHTVSFPRSNHYSLSCHLSLVTRHSSLPQSDKMSLPLCKAAQHSSLVTSLKRQDVASTMRSSAALVTSPKRQDVASTMRSSAALVTRRLHRYSCPDLKKKNLPNYVLTGFLHLSLSNYQCLNSKKEYKGAANALEDFSWRGSPS